MQEPKIFRDRQDAGQQLAQLLEKYKDQKPIVLGMPRGGVVVAYEIAKMLHAPLDVIVARKIGAPGQPEFAIGAIAPGDVRVVNPEVGGYFNSAEVNEIIEREKQEMDRRIEVFRGNKPGLEVKDRVVIIADDGVATGQSALAAVRSVRKMGPKKIILVAGACALDAVSMLEKEADEVICISLPDAFYAVGLWFQDFAQTTDEEVIALLEKNRQEMKNI
jgi:putative phosphoribosyl transferase